MKIIFETENVKVRVPNYPHITRKEWWHIVVSPKKIVENRSDLEPKIIIELARLVEISWIAMKKVLNNSWILVERINYQDNWNWAYLRGETPEFHYHLYGRAKWAEIQKFWHACVFPYIWENPEFYQNIEPLNSEDINLIWNEIKNEFENNNRYRNDIRGL